MSGGDGTAQTDARYENGVCLCLDKRRRVGLRQWTGPDLLLSVDTAELPGEIGCEGASCEGCEGEESKRARRFCKYWQVPVLVIDGIVTR